MIEIGNSPHRLYIVANPTFSRDTACLALRDPRRKPPIEVIRASTLEFALLEAPILRPTIFLLDLVSSPAHTDSIESLSKIAPVVALTRQEDPLYRIIQLGADGVVRDDDSAFGKIKVALDEVSLGNRYYPENALTQLVGEIRKRKEFLPQPKLLPDGRSIDSILTSRELDVFELVGQGMTNQQIADRLCIVPSTVRSHLQTVFQKFGLKNRAQAAILATQLALKE